VGAHHLGVTVLAACSNAGHQVSAIWGAIQAGSLLSTHLRGGGVCARAGAANRAKSRRAAIEERMIAALVRGSRLCKSGKGQKCTANQL
jgi:hypothetical protein